ncbi:hypothetical protein BESB_071160 [Besnoitia besnoiti]|uniref:Uncharacterized protein n=1 Tax=Besnoitia besnoiti TaxID=94643 RepID=A0A2A9M9T6_BESBE|nr:uncharacterized protein BESB_071160 [Besnoitia besnoiti]PFH33964.1 hypothetical protein BESB_071160 [Besnoitia besnoiti]
MDVAGLPKTPPFDPPSFGGMGAPPEAKGFGNPGAVPQANPKSPGGLSPKDVEPGRQTGRIRVKGPSMVGDIRTNLDDIKSSLVSYYGRLYSGTSPSIADRIDALSFRGQSAEPSSRWLRRRERETKYEALAEANMDGFPSRSGRDRGYEDIDETPEMAGFGGQRSAGRFNKKTGEVYDMLRDLRLKCETASAKLNTVSDELYPQISNPNLREWEYTTINKARRRPEFGNQEELRHHATNLYRHLHTQAEINQSRINSLQSKMKILYMQTKAEMTKHQQDPRVGL